MYEHLDKGKGEVDTFNTCRCVIMIRLFSKGGANNNKFWKGFITTNTVEVNIYPSQTVCFPIRASISLCPHVNMEELPSLSNAVLQVCIRKVETIRNFIAEKIHKKYIPNSS